MVGLIREITAAVNQVRLATFGRTANSSKLAKTSEATLPASLLGPRYYASKPGLMNETEATNIVPNSECLKILFLYGRLDNMNRQPLMLQAKFVRTIQRSPRHRNP